MPYGNTPEGKHKHLLLCKKWWARNHNRRSGYRAKYKVKQSTLRPWLGCYYSSKRRAGKRGLVFNLTLKWGEDTYTGKCCLTGIPFVVKGVTSNPFAISIDRIYPEMGYTDGNCRFVLFAINSLKGIGTDEDMFKIASSLVGTHK